MRKKRINIEFFLRLLAEIEGADLEHARSRGWILDAAQEAIKLAIQAGKNSKRRLV